MGSGEGLTPLDALVPSPARDNAQAKVVSCACVVDSGSLFSWESCTETTVADRCRLRLRST